MFIARPSRTTCSAATVPGARRLLGAVGRTLASELPQVLAWPALRFNTILLGFERSLAPAELRRRLRAGPAELSELRALLARDAVPVRRAGRPWTDDRAPVEWVTDRMIVAYASEGGKLEEDILPTRPG